MSSTAPSSNPFNDFLKANSWWIAILIVGIIVVVVLSIFLSYHFKRQEKKDVIIPLKLDGIITSLGGINNIKSSIKRGSRVTIELTDMELVDKTQLKESGIDSVIFMSDKVVLLSQKYSDDINELISQSINL